LEWERVKDLSWPITHRAHETDGLEQPPSQVPTRYPGLGTDATNP
jgi:hypothetical protein